MSFCPGKVANCVVTLVCRSVCFLNLFSKSFNFLISLPYIHSEQTVSSYNGTNSYNTYFRNQTNTWLQVVTFMDHIYNINFNWINSTFYGSHLLQMLLYEWVISGLNMTGLIISYAYHSHCQILKVFLSSLMVTNWLIDHVLPKLDNYFWYIGLGKMLDLVMVTIISNHYTLLNFSKLCGNVLGSIYRMKRQKVLESCHVFLLRMEFIPFGWTWKLFSLFSRSNLSSKFAVVYYSSSNLTWLFLVGYTVRFWNR